MSTFFGVTSQMSDPRIIYDHQYGRWVACAVDAYGAGNVILAISNNENPTNLLVNWTKYEVPVHRSGQFTDYVTLGSDKNGLYLSVLHHSGDIGHTIVAIKKPQIYQGTKIATNFFIPRTNGSAAFDALTIQPAVNFDDPPAGGYAWFVAKDLPQHSPSYQGGAVRYRRLKWNGNEAAWEDASWQTLSESTASYRNYFDFDDINYNTSVVGAPNLGSPTNINFGYVGSRLMMATIRNGHLYTCHHIGLDGTDGIYDGNASGTTVDRSAIQWLKLAIGSGNDVLTLADIGRIYDRAPSNPFWYYFPSLAVNAADDMVLGFSGSSASHYIGAYYAWQPACGLGDGLPRLIHDGNFIFSGERWGDYSYTSVDPTDGITFWTVQEHADHFVDYEGEHSIWSTWVSGIKPQP